jgi:hypothetical protein
MDTTPAAKTFAIPASRSFAEIEADVAARRQAYLARKAAEKKAAPKAPGVKRGHAHSANPNSKRSRARYGY